MGKLQEMVRGRLRTVCAGLGLSQVRVAEYLQVDKSIISRLLSPEGTAITLDFLEDIAPLIQRTPAELVADPTAALQSVTPQEGMLLSRAREMTDAQRHALLVVIDWQRNVAARPRRAVATTGSDAALLELFHRLDADPTAQAAVVNVLQTHPLAHRDESPHATAPRASHGHAPQKKQR